MEFIVRRTSEWGDKKPCEEAFRLDCFQVDERLSSSVEEMLKAYAVEPGEWESRGTNHRVYEGRIRRDFAVHKWAIQIESLADLVAFYEKYGDLVLHTSWYSRGDDSFICMIEIYDDYRE